MIRVNSSLSCLALSWTLLIAVAGGEEVSFRRDIAPILLNRCWTCHNDETNEGSYSVDSFAKLRVAGDSGESPFENGNATNPGQHQGELLRRLVTEDVDQRMPLDGDPLPETEIDLVRRWVLSGAKFDGDDRNAALSSILPIKRHPLPPDAYPHPVPVTALGFAPTHLLPASDAQHLFVPGYHELIRWDVKQRKIFDRIRQTGERIYDVAISNEVDGFANRIYVASGTPGRLGELRVFSTSGNLVGVPLVTTESMFALAIRYNNAEQPETPATIAVAGGDRSIYLIDARTNNIFKEYASHSDWVRALCWSPDKKWLASASRDKTVKLFDPKVDSPIDTYSGHGADVIAVGFNPKNSQQLVSCDAEGGVHFWKALSDAKTVKGKLKATHTFALATTSDGVWLSSGIVRGNTEKYSLTKFDWSGKKVLETHELPNRGLAIDCREGSSVDELAVCVGLLDGRLWCLTSQGARTYRVLP